ncbi:MAG: metallophosphoesterase [Clostridiales bacterium]|nr:metallophosphoesterase [Clostridiales bacterium]
MIFTVITDTHFFKKPKHRNEGDTPFECEEILNAAFRQIANDDESDIVLVAGDVTNNGEKCSHDGVVELFRYLKEHGKKVYVITATHDFNDSGETHGHDENGYGKVPALKREELFEKYREFGPDEAIAIHRETMSYVVQLPENCRLFALNDDNNGKGKSGFSDDLVKWIAEQADDAHKNGQLIIPMTHHPLIPPNVLYAIFGAHQDMLADHEDRVRELADNGISFILTGHTHMHDVSYTFTEKKNFFCDITTSALTEYPGAYRKIEIPEDRSCLKIKTEFVTEPINADLGGLSLGDYLKKQLTGTVNDMIYAAANDIPRLSGQVIAISMKPSFIMKNGWIILPIGKLVSRLKLGFFGNITRSETGLSKKDYADIKDEKLVDFILSIFVKMFSGDADYTPDGNHYKITSAFVANVDSLLSAAHVKLDKFIGGAKDLSSLVIPLIYNVGLPDNDVVIPLYPTEEEIKQLRNDKGKTFKPKKTKNGKLMLATLVPAALVSIPLLPPTVLALLSAYKVHLSRHKR